MAVAAKFDLMIVCASLTYKGENRLPRAAAVKEGYVVTFVALLLAQSYMGV